MSHYSERITIITGARQIGKTPFCQQIIQAARNNTWDIAGLLSPGVFANNEKLIIQVSDLRAEETRILARRRDLVKDDTQAILSTRKWIFDSIQMQWGNSILKNATPCDLLVIDELGPIELEEGRGWQAGIEALDSGAYQLALLVLRPELLPHGRQRWPQAQVIEINSKEDIKSLSLAFLKKHNLVSNIKT
ncbi:MAG: hypothetical protein JEZ06_18595 [Anaerolineaceae bacterium]|nr:hypothetical protein [Anaerolineaceae bacterium]